MTFQTNCVFACVRLLCMQPSTYAIMHQVIEYERQLKVNRNAALYPLNPTKTDSFVLTSTKEQGCHRYKKP